MWFQRMHSTLEGHLDMWLLIQVLYFNYNSATQNYSSTKRNTKNRSPAPNPTPTYPQSSKPCGSPGFRVQLPISPWPRHCGGAVGVGRCFCVGLGFSPCPGPSRQWVPSPSPLARHQPKTLASGSWCGQFPGLPPPWGRMEGGGAEARRGAGAGDPRPSWLAPAPSLVPSYLSPKELPGLNLFVRNRGLTWSPLASLPLTRAHGARLSCLCLLASSVRGAPQGRACLSGGCRAPAVGPPGGA